MTQITYLPTPTLLSSHLHSLSCTQYSFRKHPPKRHFYHTPMHLYPFQFLLLIVKPHRTIHSTLTSMAHTRREKLLSDSFSFPKTQASQLNFFSTLYHHTIHFMYNTIFFYCITSSYSILCILASAVKTTTLPMYLHSYISTYSFTKQYTLMACVHVCLPFHLSLSLFPLKISGDDPLSHSQIGRWRER